jgi:adenosylcobinamide-GDP ribazoletransferase
MPPGAVDRAAAGVAMSVAPLVGVALGASAAGALAGLLRLGATPLLAAALAVGGLALATRGLHLDGLADTADGLGSAAAPDRALAVMRSPEVGAFGVATLILVLLAEVAALAQLVAGRHWLAATAGVAVGRVAICWGCRRGLPAARADGLGALVAGTVPLPVCLLWTLLAGAAGAAAVDLPVAGVAAVLTAVAVAVGLVGHARRRLGGMTGDVLGAACEAAVLGTWALLALAA